VINAVIGIIAALAVVPHPGGYGTGGGRDTPRARLTLSYAAETGSAAGVTLTCEPDGGGHPRAVRACAALTRAGGDPDRIRPRRVYCMTVYAPVTAEMTGVWRGRNIRWQHTYGNACEMRRATGVLFAF